MLNRLASSLARKGGWVLRSLTSPPFDTTTTEGRTQERYRLAARASVANALSRICALLVMVLSVSLTVPYLGAERFGVWMTIASFTSMLIFLDLGVGNGLTNRVAQVAALGDAAALRATIGGGLVLLFLIACAASAGLALVAYWLPWHRLIKVQAAGLHAEMLDAVMLFAVMFGPMLFATGVQRVFAGLQQAGVSHAVVAACWLLSLPLLFWAASVEASIPVLLLVTLGMQALAALPLLLLLARRGLLHSLGLWAAMRAESRILLTSSLVFFVLQFGVMVTWGADSIILASVLGAGEVAIYSVAYRLFQLVSQPLSVVNGPLWGAYADAHARNDVGFIRSTLIKSLSMTAAFGGMGVLAVTVAGPWIVEVWLSGKISVPLHILAIFAVWTFFECLGTAFAMFLNGCGIVKAQIVTVAVLTLTAIPAKLFFAAQYGLAGMVMSYAILYVTALVTMYGVLFRSRLLQKLGLPH